MEAPRRQQPTATVAPKPVLKAGIKIKPKASSIQQAAAPSQPPAVSPALKCTREEGGEEGKNIPPTVGSSEAGKASPGEGGSGLAGLLGGYGSDEDSGGE